MPTITATNGQPPLSAHLSAGYRPSMGAYSAPWAGSQGNYGEFSLREVESMRDDYQVGMCLKYRAVPLYTAEFEYECADPRVKDWLIENHERFWRRSLSTATEDQPYGYKGAEAMYRQDAAGLWNFDCLKGFEWSDCRPRTFNGQLVAVRVGNVSPEEEAKNKSIAEGGYVDLPTAGRLKPAKGIWFVHEPRRNPWYGRPVCKPMWFPWRVRTMPAGCFEDIVLFAYKFSISCVVVRHPNEFYLDAGGVQRHSADLTREMVEQIKAGGLILLSSDTDENGKYKYLVETWGQVNGDAAPLIGIAEFWDKCIQRGADVPDEVITHQGSTGGFSRSQIAASAYLMSAEQDLHAKQENEEQQVLRPASRMNFGHDNWKIKAKPLILPDQAPGGAGGPQGGRPEQIQPPEKPAPAKPLQFSQMEDAGHLSPEHWGEIVTEEAPHTRIVGPTSSGKSVMAQAIATDEDGKLFIIDPVWSPGSWGGLPAVTVSPDGDYAPIKEAIDGLLTEMKRRGAELQRGKKDFEKLTIIFDEIPDTIAEVPDAGIFIRRMAQRGRHANMHLIGIAQSSRVGSWGLENYGDAMENFCTILLGAKALEVMPDLAGEERPAVLEWRGKRYSIDLSEVPEMAARPIDPERLFKLPGVKTEGGDGADMSAEFREDEHPRDEEGKFAGKEGGQHAGGEHDNRAGSGIGETGERDRGVPGETGNRPERSAATGGDPAAHGDTGRHWSGADAFPERYRDLIDGHIAKMPDKVQEYIRNVKPHFQYMTHEELEKAPGFLKNALSSAAAACLNHGRIIFMEGKEPDKETIQHELVHNAWHRIPQGVIDKAVARAVEDGQELCKLSMRRKVEGDAKYSGDRVKRIISSAKKAGDKQFALELDLMVPSSALTDLAKEAELPITDSQYLTIALHSYLAKKGEYELPGAYAQEEVLAYRAMHDDDLASEVFKHSYKAPADPRGYQPVLDRRKERWAVRTVGNNDLPRSEILGHDEWDHKDWESAVAAANKANEKAGISKAIAKQPVADKPSAHPAFHAIPHGDLAYIRGFPVRRTSEDEYRVETERGHVTGPAEKIQAHIDRHWDDQKPDRKRIDAALERASGEEPAWHTEAAQKSGEAWRALPKGTRVVVVDGERQGRLGTVVRDATEGGEPHNKVKLDGEPGLHEVPAEPLDPKLSWRVPHEEAEPEERVTQGTFFSHRGGEGQWITIGGKKGQDGKRHGGSPVYIEGGRITKGAPSLRDRKISDVEEEGTESKKMEAADVLARVKASPQFKDKDVDWDRFADRNGLEGDFHTGKASVKDLMKMVESGHLRVSKNIDNAAVSEKANTGKYNPVVITKEPGRQMLVVDGTHSLHAAALAGEKDIPVIVSSKVSQGVLGERKKVHKLGEQEHASKEGLKSGKLAAATKRENADEAGYQRAVMAKKAKAEGIPPKALHELAGDIMEHSEALVGEQREMLEYARKAAKEFGVSIQKNMTALNEGDYDSIKGFDDVAEQMAGTYPHLFAGHDPEARLAEMLSEGNPEPMSEADAYEQALEHLLAHKPESEEVPFSQMDANLSFYAQLRAELQAVMAGDADFGTFDESKHPRGQPGNAGEFGPGGGGGRGGSKKDGDKQAADESDKPEHVRAAEEDYQKNSTKAKAFKEWFGDWENDPEKASKVVDEETGDPKQTYEVKKVYHGTESSFDAFDPMKAGSHGSVAGNGFYFSENEAVAKSYAQAGGRIVTAYLNIRNPFDFDTPVGMTRMREWAKSAAAWWKQEKPNSDTPQDEVEKEIIRSFGRQQSGSETTISGYAAHRALKQIIGHGVNEVLAHFGYDGIMHQARDVAGTPRTTGKQEDHGRVWIAFEPNQIKSVTNRGTFDPESNKIDFAGYISSPESPGDGWVPTTPGPRGGKRWVRGDEKTGEKTPTLAEVAGKREGPDLEAMRADVSNLAAKAKEAKANGNHEEWTRLSDQFFEAQAKYDELREAADRQERKKPAAKPKQSEDEQAKRIAARAEELVSQHTTQGLLGRLKPDDQSKIMSSPGLPVEEKARQAAIGRQAAKLIATKEASGGKAPAPDREARIMHLSDLMTAARRGDDRTPTPDKFKDYTPPQGPQAVASVADAVKSVNTDPYIPATLASVYDAAKAKVPSLTMQEFHSVLGRLNHEGKIELRPYTRAISEIEHPEAVFPLSGELMSYASPARGK